MKKLIINYTFILIGSLCLAFGVVSFLIPNKIATGGTAGLSIIFHYLFSISTGLLFILINLPLLIVSVKYLGKRFAIDTIVTICIIALFIDLFAEIIQIPTLSKDLLLSTLYGGIITGIGLGLIFKGGASAGGGSILARIITSKTSIKTGTIILILDAIVIILAGIIFKDIELALWSMISIFVASKLIDVILTAQHNDKVVHISSSKDLNILSDILHSEIGISGTLVKGESLSLDKKRDIIFIVIEKNRLSKLRQLVFSYDNNAKIIMMEATEMIAKKRI